MESDKIVNVWDAPVAGVLRRVIAAAGDAHPVGALLGVIAAADVSDADIDQFIAEHSAANAGTEASPPLQPTPRRRHKLHRPHKPATPTPAPPPASVALPMSSA